jgi:hypothetical protein
VEYTIQGYSEITLLKYSDRLPLLYFPEAHLVDASVEMREFMSRGGQQHLPLSGWSTMADGNFILYSPSFSMKFLEVIAGSDLVEGKDYVERVERVEIVNNELILSETPTLDMSITINHLDSSGKIIGELLSMDSIEGNTIVLSGQYDGWALIAYYIHETVQKIDIGNVVNKGYYTVIGKAELYQNNSTIDNEFLYFEIPKIIINHSFSINILNSRNPEQVFGLNCTAMKDAGINGNLLRLTKRT